MGRSPTFPENNGCVLGTAFDQPVGRQFTIDCTGRRLSQAPTWSGNVSYEHVFEFSNGGELAAGGSLDFATHRQLDLFYLPNNLDHAEGYVRFNADATYTTSDQRFSVTAYIRNITNEEIPISGGQAQGAPDLYYAQVQAPRTYGLRFGAKF